MRGFASIFCAGSFMAAIAFNQGNFIHSNLDYAAGGSISLAFALIVALNIYIFMPVSDAHIIDAFARRIVDGKMASALNTTLVLDALKQAIHAPQPAHETP